MWRVMAGVAFLRRRRRKRRRSASAPYIKHPPPLLLPPTDTTTSRRYMHVYTVSLSGQGSLALNQQRPGASEAGTIFTPASAHVAYVLVLYFCPIKSQLFANILQIHSADSWTKLFCLKSEECARDFSDSWTLIQFLLGNKAALLLLPRRLGQSTRKRNQ